MYITRDYLKSSPWTAVIDMINDACFTQLFPGSTKLLSLEALGGTKTRIKIEVNRSEAPGNLLPEVPLDTYTYDRLDLTTFFRQTQTLEIRDTHLPYTSLQVVEKLSEINDIAFDLDDFEHATYDQFDDEYILRANKNSLRFVGFLRVRLINTIRVELSTVTKHEFPNVGLPDNVKAGDENLINATYYITGYDFTEHREYLRHLKKMGTHPDPKKMAAILSNVTKKPWTAVNGIASHNVAYTEEAGILKYRVLYNGMVLPRYTPRTDIQNVLVLELNPARCEDVVGEIRIHYN